MRAGTIQVLDRPVTEYAGGRVVSNDLCCDSTVGCCVNDTATSTLQFVSLRQPVMQTAADGCCDDEPGCCDSDCCDSVLL